MSGCLQFRTIPEHGASNVWVSAIPDVNCESSGVAKLRCVGRAHTPARTSARPNIPGRIAVAMFPSGRDERWVSAFRGCLPSPGCLPSLFPTDRPMDPNDALRMIKRRAKAIGLPDTICNHTFRATGITVFRKNGGTVEQAQQIANHASPRTTQLYDRSSEEITLDAVERIVI